MLVEDLAVSTIRLAKVTAVHPEAQKMEVIFLDTGDYGRDVQLMTPYGGTDFGLTTGIPAPEKEGHEENMEENDPDKRQIMAVVASIQGMHICLGYLYPQINQMAFPKDDDHKNRLIERHTSDVYRTVSEEGNMDIVHPREDAPVYIRMGEGPKIDEIEGKDFDKVWKRKHNRDREASITIRAPTIYLIGNIVRSI